MSHKEKGRIINTSFEENQYNGVRSVWITLEYDAGGCQGFGGLCLINEELENAFISEICSIFNAKKLNELINEPCYALRSLPYYNTEIEGLESRNGKRFTLTGFIKKHHPQEYVPKFEKLLKAAENEIFYLEKRLIVAKNYINSLEIDYKDWE